MTTAELLRETATEDTDTLLAIADRLEEEGYPNVNTFRDAIRSYGLWKGWKHSPSYEGVFWEVTKRAIRLVTEAEQWSFRNEHGVEWSGPYER